eukprot:c30842_g1_i1 orf=275-502(-)
MTQLQCGFQQNSLPKLCQHAHITTVLQTAIYITESTVVQSEAQISTIRNQMDSKWSDLYSNNHQTLGSGSHFVSP